MRLHMKLGTYLVTAFATILIFGSPSLASQQLEVPSDRPVVRQAMDYLRDSEEQTIDDQIALCEIPAPPFGEAARGEAYRKRFVEIGLANVRIDEEGNGAGAATIDAYFCSFTVCILHLCSLYYYPTTYSTSLLLSLID